MRRISCDLILQKKKQFCLSHLRLSLLCSRTKVHCDLVLVLSLAHSSQLAGRDTDPPFAQFHPDLELLDHSFLFLQLDEQAEAIELANSVLIEVRFFTFFTFLHSPAQFAILLLSFQISKASVKNWQSKLQTRYGWFKKENCKNIIFDVSNPTFIIFDVSVPTLEFGFRDSSSRHLKAGMLSKL